MPDARYRDLMPGWAPEYLPPEVLFWRLCRSGLCLALVAGMAPGACPLRDACRDGAISGFSYGYSLPVWGFCRDFGLLSGGFCRTGRRSFPE